MSLSLRGGSTTPVPRWFRCGRLGGGVVPDPIGQGTPSCRAQGSPVRWYERDERNDQSPLAPTPARGHGRDALPGTERADPRARISADLRPVQGATSSTRRPAALSKL